jgi:DNA invertase Pin-like site-specific DNA recombinase
MSQHIAVYARASRDPRERRVSVNRQLKLCTDRARELWPGTPVEQYHDNDLSAADPTVVRPDYARLVAAIRRGDVVAIVVNEQSRLTRQPSEWEQLVVTLTKAGITKIETIRNGPVPVEPGNRLVGRILNIIDAEEVERTKARVVAAHAMLAAEGRPSGGKAYGYRWAVGQDGRPTFEPDPDEAAAVRLMADMVLAGDSIAVIADRLTAEGVPTPRNAAQWHPNTVRSVLRKPTVAGLRVHRGEIVGPGRWDPIIEPEKWRAVVHRLTSTVTVRMRNGKDRVVRTRPRTTSRRYLLTGGLIVCGRCGAPLIAGRQFRRKGGPVKAYNCHPTSGDPNACSGLSISPADEVERHIAALVKARLRSRQAQRLLAAGRDAERGRLLAELADAEARGT